MNEDEDFEFNNLFGMVRLRVPNTGSKAREARWLEFILSTEGALRLQEELAHAIRNSEGLLQRIFK